MFRLQVKKVFLTYSQVNKNLSTKEIVLTRLIKKIILLNTTLKSYVIGEEFHENGGIHYHVVLEFNKKIRSRSPDVFDLEENHPNIQTLRTKTIFYEKIIYSVKDNNFLISDNLNLNSIKDQLKKTKQIDKMLAELYDIVKEKGYLIALEHFKNTASPLLYMRECRRVSKILKEASEQWKKINIFENKYPITNYKRSLLLEKALKETKCTWLSGPTEYQKTSAVKALLNHLKIPFKELSSNETLSPNEIIPDKTILLCDDSISKFPINNRESLIQLFDSERDREIDARWTDRKIPKGVSILVISNENFNDFLKRQGYENDLAIQRRVIDIEIKEPFLINFNIINIQNNSGIINIKFEDLPLIQYHSHWENRDNLK
jgi:hypothetical protein